MKSGSIDRIHFDHPASAATPSFAALRAFEAVGRLGGIRRAAQMLYIDHAVVSRHVRSLEHWAGVRLIDRAQSGITLTPIGHRYFMRISSALSEIGSATNELFDREEGQLVIWSIHGFAYRCLTRALDWFERENPTIELELCPTDRTPDFMRGEADVDIRYMFDDDGPLGDRECVRTMELLRPPVRAVASPSLARSLGASQPRDLLRAPLLHQNDNRAWAAWFAAHHIADAGPLGGQRLWHAHLTIEAARSGRGVALVNDVLLGDELQRGTLVEVATAMGPPPILGAYVFAANINKWHSRPVVRFRDWLQRLMLSAGSGLDRASA